MDMKLIFFLLIASGLLLFSCKQNADEGSIITKRIQYDVNIKSPEPDLDWWVQNIEGSNRELLIKTIFEKVSEGKVVAYDFLTGKPYTIDEIKRMMRQVDTISYESANPPYELRDTVIVKELRASDITRLRFLEEWYMNPKTLDFNKKIAGICPLIEKYSDSGELRGYSPLFWVFFDKKYPAELKLSN
jgi:hypothetical protein